MEAPASQIHSKSTSVATIRQTTLKRQSVLTRLMILNGIATVSLVIHHAAAWGFTMMFAWADRFRLVTEANLLDPVGSITYYLLLILVKLSSFTIPVFLFISGYYYASYALKGKTSTHNMVWSRVRKLVIPYLLWSFAIFTLEWLESCRTVCMFENPTNYLHRLLWGEADGGYYYVILMIQFILMAPLLVNIAQKRWRTLLVVTALIQLGFSTLLYFYHLGVNLPVRTSLIYYSGAPFPGMIFFFTLGLIVGLRLPDLKPILMRLRSLLPFAVALLAVAVVMEPELIYPKTVSGIASRWEFRTIAVSFYAMAIILCFVAFDRIPIPRERVFSRLGTKIFGIYLLHFLVMSYSARMISYLWPGALAYQLFLVPVLFILGLFVPLGLMWIVRRSRFRHIYPYLFG